MTRTLEGIEGIKAAVGEHLGYSPWIEVTQEKVYQFADATGDHQWIHVDVERAKAESPFGGPIAHGYLTLSLLPAMMPKVVTTTGFKMGVNYGTNRVRFMSPVPVGSRLRAGIKLLAAEDIPGGVQVVYEVTYEVEGNPKPACVAEIVLRSYV